MICHISQRRANGKVTVFIMNWDTQDFYVTSIGRVHQIDEHIYPEGHVQYRPILFWDELIFFDSTFATIYFNDYIFEIQPNDILFLPKGTHKYYYADFHQQGSFIDIFYKSSLPDRQDPQIYQAITDVSLFQNFSKILATWTIDQPGKHAKCMSILYDIISILQRNSQSIQNQFSILWPAIQYISEHWNDPHISIEYLASRCGISYSYFVRIFQNELNNTPKNYIIKQKISHCCTLLQSNKTITEIADIAGFTDICYFSKQFKKHMNMSPSEYRIKVLQNNSWYNHVQTFEQI